MIDDDQSFIWPIAPAIGQLIYLCIGIALFLACCHFQKCRSYYGRQWPKFKRFVQIFDVVRLISLIQTRGCSGLAQFDCCVALEHLSWSSRILRKHCVSSRGKVSQVGFWIFNPIQQSPRNNFPRYWGATLRCVFRVFRYEDFKCSITPLLTERCSNLLYRWKEHNTHYILDTYITTRFVILKKIQVPEVRGIDLSLEKKSKPWRWQQKQQFRRQEANNGRCRCAL